MFSFVQLRFLIVFLRLVFTFAALTNTNNAVYVNKEYEQIITGISFGFLDTGWKGLSNNNGKEF